ncbi:phosphatidylserine/phosphatidylglycerophosphate/cardiolipin synthase-like enzyme [Methanococcus maripaludis]|uniref:Phosphatidylserine/phosphatidylglycerophosphate/ cardiolipin synthase-like enzyme n=1 Tax=Methanococcus maripaludis TaxID=39152 RepID=A0A7J9NND2_METMI|nr:phospholipase D-like domain-containing protein [Methanococcus maripaludis]MBA2846997.1 phosphatidylserine/phosphatidylglycerophosphate/cardiolipin synthase-like enzyme [Methanococcus maripaludis]
MEFDLINIYGYLTIINTIILVILFFTIVKLLKLVKSNFEYSRSLTCPEDRIEVLNDEKYYYYVLNKIKYAKKEINIIMFSIYLNPKISELIDELTNARKRGVMVRVILEEEVGSNILAQSKLSSQHILVKFHDSKKTHNKLIIVDDTVIVGSHNWTDKALFENKESAIAVSNEDVLNIEKEYFESLWRSIE